MRTTLHGCRLAWLQPRSGRPNLLPHRNHMISAQTWGLDRGRACARPEVAPAPPHKIWPRKDHPPIRSPLKRVATSAHCSSSTPTQHSQLLSTSDNKDAHAIALAMASKRDFSRAFDIPVGLQGDMFAGEPQVCLSLSLFVWHRAHTTAGIILITSSHHSRSMARGGRPIRRYGCSYSKQHLFQHRRALRDFPYP